MLATEYYAVKQDLDRKGVIVSFGGYLSEDVLVALGEALRKRMALDDTDANVIQRVFSVFVEQTQNVIRYSADRFADTADQAIAFSSGMVTVGREDGRFFVVCGNAMDRRAVDHLRSHLTQLIGMDRETIRRYYRERLMESLDDDSSRANIGLIEIVRRASAPVEFDFLEIDDQRSFFCLKAFI